MDRTTSLLGELARRGVRVGVDGGKLQIQAPRGALSEELREALAAQREEILTRLGSAEGNVARTEAAASFTTLKPQRESDSKRFPLADLQLGFYIANDPYMELHVQPHYYLEFDRDALDPVAYFAAWNQTLRRHRREIAMVDGELELALIADEPALEVRVLDLRDAGAETVASELARVRREMARAELPLESWPWLDLRVTIWREGESDEKSERARIHYNHNNFFIDGFGSNLLLDEVERHFANPALDEPPLELSYRDAVLGLEALATSAAGEAARRYWFDRLPHLPPPPSLPSQSGFDRRCRSWLERRAGHLARDRWERFKERANTFGLTPSNAVIAAYAQVLATWSNSDHFILSQMATRRFAELHPDLRRMLGNFASLYPLEIVWSGALDFATNARRLQDQVLADVEHLEFGGMRVLQELNRRSGSFGTAPSPFVVGSGLFIKGYRKANFAVLETSQTLLDHQFFELADGSYFYVWDLIEGYFPDGVVDAMWHAFTRLLERLIDDESTWQASQFDLLSECDLAVRRARNQTFAAVPARRLETSLEEAAMAHPERMVFCGAGERLNARELATWSANVAAKLSELGVGRGDVVPVLLEREASTLAAVYAILSLGAAYVPIDPKVPNERLSLLLSDLGARVVVTRERHRAALIEAAAAESADLAVVAVERADATPWTRFAVSEHPTTDLAYVIYTSGSTGRPKGVMIDHRGAWNTIWDINRRFAISPNDRILGVSAFNFDLSVYDLFGSVAAGASLSFPAPEAALDPTAWLDLALAHEITIWNSVPALLSLLVEAAERRGVVLPALRVVLLSGDKIPLDLPAGIRRVAPNAEISSLGGATEASIWSIYYPVGSIDPSWATIPYGYPLANQTWEVLDRDGRPCPTWVAGELAIGGDGLAQGYWRDPEKTAARFFVDPASGKRLYRTGDLGRYLPNGALEWLGRVDFQVKIQGHRIELGEIESALLDHRTVRQAAVGVHTSRSTGQRRLVGFVAVADGAALDGLDLAAFLATKLPAYMVPTTWRALEQLPLTANGKVDRRALLDVAIDEADEEDGARSASLKPVPPANDTERLLLAIWQRVLSRGSDDGPTWSAREFGVTDDFFALGGQSFDAIRIFAQIKEQLGARFTLADLWRERTIRALAARLDSSTGARATDESFELVAMDTAGEGEPLVMVHPAGGSVLGYLQLGKALDRPLSAIQASTAEGDASRTDLAVLAARYADAVLAALAPTTPTTPTFALGGWSTGAVIAFAMAAHLEAQGQSPSHLFLLDGPTPRVHDDLSDERLLAWFLDDLALDLPLERLAGERFFGLAPSAQLRRAAELLSVDRAVLDLESLTPNLRVFRDLVAATSRYQPPTIDVDLTVVRVEHDVVTEFASHPDRDRPDWGWGRFTRGQVRTLCVAGTHHTFLMAGVIEGWSAALCAARERAQ